MISLIVVINNVKGVPTGEFARKKAVYDLLEAISEFLTLQRLLPELENPLIPDSFRNITTAMFAKAGYQLYEMRFWSSWDVDMANPDGQDLGTLKTIVANYWLEPEHDPDVDPSDAEDIINENP